MDIGETPLNIKLVWDYEYFFCKLLETIRERAFSGKSELIIKAEDFYKEYPDNDKFREDLSDWAEKNDFILDILDNFIIIRW